METKSTSSGGFNKIFHYGAHSLSETDQTSSKHLSFILVQEKTLYHVSDQFLQVEPRQKADNMSKPYLLCINSNQANSAVACGKRQ
ncbi:hypothetical protein YC2023_099362 [Brassica napus]